MSILSDLAAWWRKLTKSWPSSSAISELVGCHPSVHRALDQALDQALDHTLAQASKIAAAFKRHEPSREDINWEAQPLAAELPKGLVIYGQGCGCGGLTRAIAKELNAHYFAGTTCEPSGRPSEPASIAHYFSQAKELAQLAANGQPVLLFLSGANRLSSAAPNAVPDARATICEIANQIEKLEANSNVLVVIEADALNHVDDALMLDGRFDVQIEVEKPDYKGRLTIFCQHLGSYQDSTQVSAQPNKVKHSVQILVSLDGTHEDERSAELKQICQECAVLANGLHADQIYRALFQLQAQAATTGSVAAEQLYQAIETQQGKS
jgi:ATP-dependent 26S proteasome regulatory subunit